MAVLKTLSGAEVPWMIYGTAWKEEDTTRLVTEALKRGFRAFDVAAQPKHYREDLVGHAINEAIASGSLSRHNIWLQTKFTPPRSQGAVDLPYPADASIEEQVYMSVARSLSYLTAQDKDPYIDCLILHGPLQTFASTMQVWRAMEKHVPVQVRSLGMANVTLPVAKAIHEAAEIKPKIVQNRFCSPFDTSVRQFCSEHGLVYQGFSILRSNASLLQSSPVCSLSRQVGLSRQEALYVLAYLQGVQILNGTSTYDRMDRDLKSIDIVCGWKEQYQNRQSWDTMFQDFDTALKDAERRA